MTSISSLWLFLTQRIDIIGPLPQGKKQVKFLLVTINYLTKWVKAEPLAVITESKIQNFVWMNIVYKFGILRAIISNNGRQFDSQNFREFCGELGIKNHYLSLGHPQANGQTEVINRTLLKLIKAQLEGQRVHDQKSYQVCYGLIERLQGHQHEKHHSSQPSIQKQSFPSKQGCQALDELINTRIQTIKS